METIDETVQIQKYPIYKDSGVDWLGEIPSHWECLRMKRLFSDVSEKNKPNAELLSVTQNQGVVPRAWVENRMVMPSGNLESFKFIRKGDFAISLRSFEGGLEFCYHDGIISPAYTVLHQSKYLHSFFYKHLFKSAAFISELQTSIVGIREGKNISYPELSYSFLPIPPLEEQTRIAEFLDRKTAQIDQAIAQKERSIALLNERRQVLIHRAVTRGLNPNAAMKDSGIEWIGEIPAHWDVIKMGFCAMEIQTGPFGSQLHSHEYVEGGIPIINPSHIVNGKLMPDYFQTINERKYQQLKRHSLLPGDIVFGRRGEMGRCAVVQASDKLTLCGTGSIKISLKREKIYPNYIGLFLRLSGIKDWLSLESVGSTMENLNTEILSKMSLLIPPLDEQLTIVKYINTQNNVFDNMIAIHNAQIQKLQELKATLINSAVTGKIKV